MTEGPLPLVRSHYRGVAVLSVEGTQMLQTRRPKAPVGSEFSIENCQMPVLAVSLSQVAGALLFLPDPVLITVSVCDTY